MRLSALRSIAPGVLLLLCCNPANAAGPPLPKALADAPAVSAALNNTLELAKTGSRTRWDSPGGRHGFITINRTWFPKPDQPCREYLRSLVNPTGKPTLMHGTGCRDDNGKWMLLETQRAAVTAASDCPPAAVATPLPATPIRSTPAPRPATTSTPPTASSGKPPTTTSSSKTKATKAAPAPTASTSSTTATRKSASNKATSSKAATPAASVDPAAAAVIDASRPTPAEW